MTARLAVIGLGILLLGSGCRFHGLTEKLVSKDEGVRSESVRQLSVLGFRSRKALVPALVTKLSDLDPEVRVRAAEALGDIVARTNTPGVNWPTAITEALPALVERVLDQGERAEVRKQALLTLTNLGPAFLAPVHEPLTDDEERIRQPIYSRIKGGDGAIPLVVENISQCKREVDFDRKYILGNFLVAIGTSAVPSLVKFLENSESTEGGEIFPADQLVSMGSDAFPQLADAASAGHPRAVRIAAVECLGRLKDSIPQIDALLKRLARDPDPAVRQAVQAELAAEDFD